jgi:hypothetical protein
MLAATRGRPNPAWPLNSTVRRQMKPFGTSTMLALAGMLVACSVPVKVLRDDISFTYSDSSANSFASSFHAYESITGKTTSTKSPTACKLMPSEAELVRFESALEASKLFDEPQQPIRRCDFSVDSSSTLKIRWRGEERQLFEDQCNTKTKADVWRVAYAITGPRFDSCER